MRRPLLAFALVATAVPAVAQQQSESYKFLQAIRDAKGEDVTKMLDTPGSTIINTQDRSTGETALHIVVKRGDTTYTNYLLARGANANARDRDGNTPLILAVNGGNGALVAMLAPRANVNLANSNGETPLIRAVQIRNIELVRVLLAAGADADQTDNMAGLSARQYAAQDTRSPAIAKLLADTPKKVRRAVAGPKF